MLTLAVATRGETFERMGDPLAERGIRVEHVGTDERTVALADREPWRGYDVGFVYPSRPTEGGVADVLMGVPWVNDRAAVLTSRNKAGVLAHLGREGLPVPRTVLVSNPVSEADLRATFERFDPPVVVKPTSTTRGTGVTKVADLDSFLGVADYLGLIHDYPATGDRSFLVQEFVPDARDFRAMVLDGDFVGAVERRGEGWKHNVHRGASAASVDLDPPLRELAERTAETLGITLLGVDLLVSGSDGRAVVNETNARPTIDTAEKYRPGFYDRLAAVIRATASE